MSASPRSSMATRVVPSGGNHHELLHMHRSVIVLERFELQLGARLLVHQLGATPDGFLLEAIRANLLIILRRHNPAGAAHIRCPKIMGKSRKGSLK